MVFVYLLIVLLISALAAIEMREIAKMKGFDESKYFWWSFLVFPFGAAMVIALPDRGDKQINTNTPNDDLPDM